jgi:FkbM family methyltransferase
MTKPSKTLVNENKNNQIIYTNNQDTHILPQSNIKYYLENGLFESNLIEWCKQLCNNEKVFLDIGAHTGTYSISLSDYCLHVHSFEPQKMTFYSLCGSVALSGKENITCWNYGLGSPEQVGEQTLKIISNDGGGSSLHYNHQPILKEEIIKVKTLDDFNITNIGFIKMDVEDNELYVLKGALNTIKKNNYPRILFESNNNNTQLFDYVKEIGYKDVIPINGYNNMFLTI